MNIGGVSTDKYITEQVEKLIEFIKEKGYKKEDIFVISPFTSIVAKLKKDIELKKLVDAKNIGTVHSFQGKEAKTVFFVLGCSQSEIGAANWAFSEPNILNVAATRAKENFYIIGDRNVYKNMRNSKIAMNILDRM